MKQIKLLYLHNNAVSPDHNIFGRQFINDHSLQTINGTEYLVHSSKDADEILLSLAKGKWQAYHCVLLLGIDFSGSRLDSLKLADPPHSNKDKWGFDILRTVKRIDPDFPVVVLTDSTIPEILQQGKFEADDFITNYLIATVREQSYENFINMITTRLYKAIETCRQRAVYDHEHLATADKFSQDYDRVERSSFATVAYYHFENEIICQTVSKLLRKHPQNSKLQIEANFYQFLESIPSNRRLQVLDIGCGTGRIEEFLSHHPLRGKIEVVAVDFSGSMLKCAKSKLENLDNQCSVVFGENHPPQEDGKLHVSLFRSPAEHLAFLKDRYPEGFDLVIMGFGLLSYVKYTDVLLASPEKPASTGVFPLLKNGGKLLFSVYNEESAIYARVANLDYPDSEIPIAALMDLTEGRLKVGEHYFNCEAFTKTRIMRFMRQAGLSVAPENVWSFPTLHLMMNNSEVNEFLRDDPDFPPGKFSEALYKLDWDLSRVLPDRGHYMVGIAEKPLQNRKIC